MSTWQSCTPQEVFQGGQIVRSSRREVPDLLSWLQCFDTYACVFCEAFPEKRKELWAYQEGKRNQDLPGVELPAYVFPRFHLQMT